MPSASESEPVAAESHTPEATQMAPTADNRPPKSPMNMPAYVAVLNGMSADEVAAWLHRRLHGLDDLCPPPNNRDYERRYVLVSRLLDSPRMEHLFKRYLTAAIVSAVREAAAHYPSGAWHEPLALDSLFLLASDLCIDNPTTETGHRIARALTELANRLPFEADGIRLRQFALLTLVETGIKQNEDFWRDQWAAATAPDQQPPWLAFAGVVFEGIYRGKGTGLKEACHWMAQATPWDAEVMRATLDQMLPAILAKEESTADVEKILGDHLMLPLGDAARQKAVREICMKHGLEVWTEVPVPAIHRPVLASLMQGLDGSVHADMSASGINDSQVICSDSAAEVIRKLFVRYEEQKNSEFTQLSAKEQWAIIFDKIWNDLQLHSRRPVYARMNGSDELPGQRAINSEREELIGNALEQSTLGPDGLPLEIIAEVLNRIGAKNNRSRFREATSSDEAELSPWLNFILQFPRFIQTLHQISIQPMRKLPG